MNMYDFIAVRNQLAGEIARLKSKNARLKKQNKDLKKQLRLLSTKPPKHPDK